MKRFTKKCTTVNRKVNNWVKKTNSGEICIKARQLSCKLALAIFRKCLSVQYSSGQRTDSGRQDSNLEDDAF